MSSTISIVTAVATRARNYPQQRRFCALDLTMNGCCRMAHPPTVREEFLATLTDGRVRLEARRSGNL